MKAEKNKRLNCRITEEEYKFFEERVRSSKLTKSEFMRRSILNKDIIVIEEIKELVLEMKAIGRSLNSLARDINTQDKVEKKALKEMKSNFNHMSKEIIQALRKVNR